MSLLNEALRKNKNENQQKINLDFHSQDTRIPARKGLVVLILIIFLICSSVFAWIKLDDDTEKSGHSGHQIMIKEGIPDAVRLPEPVVSETIVPNNVVKELKSNNVSTERKINDKMSTDSHKPDSLTTISKPPEIREPEDKQEKILEISRTEKEGQGDNFYRKALQLHRQGRLGNAISMYREALNYNPENVDALFNLSSIYITMSRYSDAYDILKNLLSANPADIEIILNLAVSEIGLGNNRDALSHLNSINENNPEFLFRINFHRGVALSRFGNKDEALSCYKNAERLNPENPALLLNMAVLYDRLGKYSEAIYYYSKLISSDLPDSNEKNKFKHRIETLQNNLSEYPAEILHEAAK